MTVPTWALYEREVFECLRDHFPGADVRQNVRLRGRYSKRMRQIDILVTEHTPAGPLKVVVDAKRYVRKVTVKTVEEFEGLLSDVGIARGLLISNRGYSRSALRRAFYGPTDIELDILDFSELKRWQGFRGIPYVGDNAFIVPAPFGWVIDINRDGEYLCTMFRRGLDAETAKREKEFLYTNIWSRIKDPLTAEQLDELQVTRMNALGLSTRVSHRAPIKRADALTRIRCVQVKEYKSLEVTGFIEFADIIFFAVLLTPIEKQKQNIRRLEHVMRSAVRVRLERDNTKLIESLKMQLRQSASDDDRAKISLDIGHWYRDMKCFAEAKAYLESSVSLRPNYWNIRELILTLLALEERSRTASLLRDLLTLDLRNPTVFNDAIRFEREADVENELLEILRELAREPALNSLERGNCLYYAAQVLYRSDVKGAKRLLAAARQLCAQSSAGADQLSKAIRFSLKQWRSTA